MSAGRDWALLRMAGSGREIARACRARTLWERFRGLMLAPPLRPGEALWLPACGAVHTAFLRAPVDLLFLKGQEVVRVCGEVPPWRIAACAGADSVLEMAAGEARRHGIAAGLRLEIGPDLGHGKGDRSEASRATPRNPVPGAP